MILISTEIISSVASIKIYPLYEDTNSIKTNFSPILVSSLFLLWFIDFNNLEDTFNISMATFSTYNTVKLRKVRSIYKWKEVVFKINNRVFTTNLLIKFFTEFWNNVSDQFNNNNHMFILFKIKYNNGEFSSIGKVQRINITDLNWYIDFIIEQMKFKSEYYNETPITEFIFSYGFKSEKIANKTIKMFEYNQEIKGLKIPISMTSSDFGTIIKTINSIFFIQNELGQTISIEQVNKNKLVTIASKGKVLISFEDKFIEENKFVRIINNKKYYFINNEEVAMVDILKSKFIEVLKPSKDLVNKIITLDIETYIENGDLIPYLISFYDGDKCYNFLIEDYKNTEDMILDCFSSIFY